MHLAAVIPAMVLTQRLIPASGGSELCSLPAAVRSTGIFVVFFWEGGGGESQLNRPMVLVLRALCSTSSFFIFLLACVCVCVYLCALILHPRKLFFFGGVGGLFQRILLITFRCLVFLEQWRETRFLLNLPSTFDCGNDFTQINGAKSLCISQIKTGKGSSQTPNI